MATRTVQLPLYFAEAVWRHYRDLARTEIPSSDTRAANAKRVSRRELARLRAMIDDRLRELDNGHSDE